MEQLDPRDAVLRHMLASVRPGERRQSFLPILSLVQQHGAAAANAAIPASLPQGFALGLHDEPRVYKASASSTSLLHWMCLHGKGQYVGLLVARGANVHRVDVNGRTALMTAASSGCAVAVRALLQCGARADLTCAKGYTPLLLAALKGSVEAVSILLAWAADTLDPRERAAFVNARLSTGLTALSLAARDGNLAMAETLHRHGAHQAVSYDGESTVEIATKYGHRELAAWLVDKLHSADSTGIESRHAQLLHREVRPGGVDEYGQVIPPVAL